MSAPLLQSLSLLAPLSPAPYVDRFARVLGSRLGPEYVTSAQAMADQGYFWQWADLLTECRLRDPHLHGVLARRELRVAGAAWEMRAPSGSGAAGEEVARWCDARLREMEADGSFGRSFSTMLADLMGGVYHGRAGHEVLWRVEPRDGGGEWWVPRTAEWIMPRRFAMATDWRLHLWDSSGTGESATEATNLGSPFGTFPGVCIADVNAIAPGKYVVHCPRVTGEAPTREGVGYVTTWPAVFKRMGVREFVAFIAWAARGLRKGTYNVESTAGESDGASRDNEAKLIEAAVNWSAQSAAIIPSTCSLEVETVAGEGKPQQQFIEWCNGEVSKAVLGSTLGTDAGQRGARSLGEVHERGEETLAIADARALSETLRAMLLRPMVEWSFGRDAPVPEIAFDVAGTKDTAAAADLIEKAARNGIEVSQEDARNLLGLPDPRPGAKLVIPVTGPNGGRIATTPQRPAEAPSGAPGAVDGPTVVPAPAAPAEAA